MGKVQDDRGVYRAIYVTIWDDKDFLKLSPEAKLVLLNLRTGPLSNMPCIYRFYKEAIREQTGLPEKAISKAMDTLSDTLWITVQDNLVWVRNALRYDPSIYLNNPKHIEAIKKIISGLPKLQIVIDFCTYYGIEIPYPIPYPIPYGIHPDQDPEKEKEKDIVDTVSEKNNGNLFGEFHNVKLTEEEHQKLMAQFGENGTQDRIENLSQYIASKGKRYSSHYATILSWDRKENREGGRRVATGTDGAPLDPIERRLWEAEKRLRGNRPEASKKNP